MLLLSILFSSWFFSQPNWQVFSNISIIILVLSLNKIKKFKSPFFTQLCNVLKNVVKTSKFYPPWKHQKPKVFCCFRGESNLEAFIIFFKALQCDMKKMGPRFPSYNVTLSKFKDTCMTNRSQMFWRITMLLNILQNSTWNANKPELAILIKRDYIASIFVFNKVPRGECFSLMRWLVDFRTKYVQNKSLNLK